MFLRFLLLATTLGAFTVAGCSANGTGTGPGASAVTAAAVPNTSLGQILIAFDSNSGRLEYWNFGTGGSKAQWLSRTLHISDAMGMVANGDTVYIASDSPPAIVSYDVNTKKTTTLGDPYGAPLDVAIDRNADVYALNAGNVTVFPPRAQPYELSCPFISASTAIAVDNEANVFVGGSGPGSFAGIVEYATGSSTCAKLPIKTKASVTGLGVNPRTDALIVVDNVNLYRRFRGPGDGLPPAHRFEADCPPRQSSRQLPGTDPPGCDREVPSIPRRPVATKRFAAQLSRHQLPVRLFGRHSQRLYHDSEYAPKLVSANT